MEKKEKIRYLREKIEALDDEILRLLNKRAGIVLEVGKVKSEGNFNFYDPKRESEILSRLTSQNPGPFPGQMVPSPSPVFWSGG